jgi:hypothetical protein
MTSEESPPKSLNLSVQREAKQISTPRKKLRDGVEIQGTGEEEAKLTITSSMIHMTG